jgi:hypothetical protein
MPGKDRVKRQNLEAGPVLSDSAGRRGFGANLACKSVGIANVRRTHGMIWFYAIDRQNEGRT